MGLDLTLLPFDCDQGNFCFSHTMLDCERRRDLFEAIMKMLKETPVPDGFMSFRGRTQEGDTSYGVTTTTPYGAPLGWVPAGDLVNLGVHIGVLDNHLNRAIWAYLRELPKETKVALFWH